MALIKADRVKETSTSETTANFILGGAATGYRAFSSVCAVGDTFYYAISHQTLNQWECGLGTYGAGNVLERTTVHASSNSGAKVNFSAGTKECFLTLTARHLDRINDNGQSTAIGSKTSVVAVNDSATLPDLDLQFAELKTLTAKYGPTPSYSRASIGYYTNASGVLTSAAVNEPRFDHVLENGAWVSKGLLIEEQRTNVLTNSNNFTSSFPLGSAQFSSSATISPDGTNNAWKIFESAAAGGALDQRRYNTVSFSGSQSSFSIYAKAAERRRILLFVNGPNKGSWFDLISQTCGNDSNFTGAEQTIQNVGNGWYKCTIITPSAASIGNLQIQILLDGTTTNAGNRIGDGVSGIYIAFAQHEVGAFSTSYIPTTSSSVVRSADVCQITGSAFSNLWNASEGSVAADFDFLFPASAGTFYPYIYEAGGTAPNRISLYGASSTNQLVYILENSSTYSTITSSPFPSASSLTKVASAYKLNDLASATNGAAVGIDQSQAIPSVTTLSIGNSAFTGGAAPYLNGHIARLRYFRSRLDNTQLVNLSGGINTLAFKPLTGSGSVTVANEYSSINVSVPNPLPITNGGTGAQTQLAAVTNLVGNPPNDGAQYTLASKKTSGTPTYYWVDGTGYAPTLDLLFAADKSLTPYVGPTPSFSRASTGSYYDSTGTLRYANVNLLTYSEQFNIVASGWTDSLGTTSYANETLSPINDMTADRLIITSSGYHLQKKAYTATGSHTFSVWLKAKLPTTVCIRVSNDAGTQSVVSNCSVTTSWQRFSVSVNFTSSPVNFYAGFDQRAVVGGPGASADFYAWGAQFELSSSPTTYVKTEATINAAPRFDHTYNGTSWVSRGLLVEEQRTNVCQYSEDFSNGFYVKYDVTIGANAGVAPDGSQTADLIYPTTSGDYRAILHTFSSTNGQSYTISFFAKAMGINWVSLPDAIGSNFGARFNLSNGTIGNVAAGVNASIQNCGNGWYRCSVTVTAGGGGSIYFAATISDGNTGNNVTKNGTDGVLIWGAQVETGSFPTSYIPATSASVTRSADVCQITGSDFSSFWNASEGSFAVEWDSIYDAAQASSRRLFLVQNFDATARLNAEINNGSINWETVPAGANISAAFTLSANQTVKNSFAYKINDFALVLNGAVAGTDTSVNVPSGLTILNIGNGVLTTQCGHIARLRYYPVRLPNATLQTLST